MRIIPLDIEFESGRIKDGICRVAIFTFDWYWNELSLFEIGWWQGHLLWDFLGASFLYRWLKYGGKYGLD